MQLLLYNIAIILVLFEFFFDTEYLQGKFLIYLPTDFTRSKLIFIHNYSSTFSTVKAKIMQTHIPSSPPSYYSFIVNSECRKSPIIVLEFMSD